jgi:small-conductance mechanosensitive channel
MPRWMLVLACAVLLASALSNTLGNVSMATMLTGAVLDSSYAALALYAGATVLVALFKVLLARPRVSQLTGRHAGSLIPLAGRLGRTLLLLGWLAYTLEDFRIYRPLSAMVIAALGFELHLGGLTLSLGNAAAFVAATWAAFWLARTTRGLLAEDLLPALKLPRGVGRSVSTLSYYGVLVLGLLAALAAAGFKLGELAIVFGALGLGIGLGLQDVVKNFVAGLILMFERPIQPGDVVEVAGLTATVRNIGLRATTLITFDGADVVLPNGMLLADKLVNWTLTGNSRRINIDVSTVYDASPQPTIALLIDIANRLEGIAAFPQPTALLTGLALGELQFNLRAWTTPQADWVAVRSELAMRIRDALAEAGIPVPLPQRELHLRSASGPVAGTPVAGRRPPAELPARPSPCQRGTGARRSAQAHPHPRRQRAHQLVAHGAGGLRHLVDAQHRAILREARAPAPQRDLAAEPRGRHCAQVDRQHVHRHPAHGDAAHAVHQHRRSAAAVAGVAVGIAAGDDADAHRRLGHKAAAVAHAVAALQMLGGDQFRAQRHRRLQGPVGDGVLGKIRRAAVEQQAGAHPVAGQAAARRHVPQQRGTVAQRALAGQVARGLLERHHLVGDAARAVGVGEVRHQRDLVDLRQRVQPRPGAAECGRCEAQPVHAAVHLEEHAVRLVRLVAGQPIDLLLAVHRVPQVQARAQLQVARLEHAFQQQDGPAPLQRAQALGFGQVEQRKTVGGAQRVEHAFDAVAVGVGLDHCPDPRIGGLRARPRQVVGQGIGMDQGFDRARHGAILPACPAGPAALAPGAWPGRSGVRAITAPRSARPQKPAAQQQADGARLGPSYRQETSTRWVASRSEADEKRLLHHHGRAVLQLAG